MNDEKSNSLFVPVKRPFVILAKGMNCLTGEPAGVPVGIEIADNPKHAFEQATVRWPDFDFYRPVYWNDLVPSARLAAIKADRGDTNIEVQY